jgi:hypothetical protein
MLAVAGENTQGESHVTLQQLSQGDLPRHEFRKSFDGVFSNFGGLNAIPFDDAFVATFAAAIARSTKPDAWLILVPMGRIYPWEIAHFLWHRQPREAFRRFSAAR